VWRLSTVVCLFVSVTCVHSCLSVGFLCGVYPQLFVCSFLWRVQLWTNVTQKTNRQTTVDKRHTENQQTTNCGHASQKRTDKQLWINATQKTSCLFVGFLCGVCPQLFFSWFLWCLFTVVCLLIFCVTFVHSCLSVGFCDVCPQLFVCWYSVRRLSTVVFLLVIYLIILFIVNICKPLWFPGTQR
jgi:hypothetical protein